MKFLLHSFPSCFACASALVLFSLLTGCASKGGKPQKVRSDKFTLEIIGHDSIRGEAVDVALIGVKNDLELKRLNEMSVHDYFDKEDLRRSTGDKQEFRLDHGQTNLVSSKDPIWSREWKDAGHLVVLANLPGADQEGALIQRRQVIPLDDRLWKTKRKTLRIEVRSSGIHVMNAQKRG